MIELKYKLGIRVEPYTGAVYLGLGVTWFSERAFQIDVLFWSITVGLVYDDTK